MTLTKKDKAWLASLGYGEQDFPQINEALHASRTVYSLDDRQITRAEALQMLGRERFLAGISRSAFHFTSAQIAEDGKAVYFDSYKLFQKGRRS